jgi:predicted DNA-binding transcriptional regulator AlpA
MVRFSLEKGRIFMSEDVTPQKFGLSVTDAARLLGIGRTLLWAEIKAGRFPTRRMGKRVVVSSRSVERFLEGSLPGYSEAAKEPPKTRKKRSDAGRQRVVAPSHNRLSPHVSS